MRRRTAMAAAALVALAACGGGGGGATSGFATAIEAKPVQTEQPPNKQPPAPCSVAYWGDSISAMTAPRIGKGLQVNVHGVIGGTAQAALPTFLQDPLAERFVVIEYGMNDSNGAAASSFEMSVRSMLDRVKAVGRTPVLTGISNATAGEVGVRANLNLLLSKLATDYGAVWANWPATSGALTADGVHPTDAYAQALADALTAAIVKTAPECAQP